ncbi:hypothetical protein RT717_17705 [Imperialibacter roseus]|uniref:Uncharacterized protein n=1 Tax=Imperialibacter roseus TaxID=1324217 RepID=A0ABZ0IJQ2_9BACT|nr:hypothetical protein [Imperialibacter roseus]WOK04921.1 hypothetical protein RT717_17705 [Imperialibacter roseus]
MEANNIITIAGGTYGDVKKALKQWLRIYSNDLPEDFQLQMFKNGQRQQIIKADDRLDNEKFFYLVNYLKYPENINYKVIVDGFTIGKLFPQLLDRQIQVYVSETDSSGDNVLVVTAGNEKFKIGFDNTICSADDRRTYAPPSLILADLGNPEIIKSSKSANILKQKKNGFEAAASRNKLLLYLAIGFVSLSFLTVNTYREFSVQLTFVLGLGLVAWFFTDYEMLQYDKLFSYCLLAAIGLAVYGYWIEGKNHMVDHKLVKFGTLYPVVFLGTQKPLRLIFLRLFSAEPTTEKHFTAFWQPLYIFFLVILPMITIILLTV